MNGLSIREFWILLGKESLCSRNNKNFQMPARDVQWKYLSKRLRGQWQTARHVIIAFLH